MTSGFDITKLQSPEVITYINDLKTKVYLESKFIKYATKLSGNGTIYAPKVDMDDFTFVDAKVNTTWNPDASGITFEEVKIPLLFYKNERSYKTDQLRPTYLLGQLPAGSWNSALNLPSEALLFTLMELKARKALDKLSFDAVISAITTDSGATQKHIKNTSGSTAAEKLEQLYLSYADTCKGRESVAYVSLADFVSIQMYFGKLNNYHLTPVLGVGEFEMVYPLSPNITIVASENIATGKMFITPKLNLISGVGENDLTDLFQVEPYFRDRSIDTRIIYNWGASLFYLEYVVANF